MLRVCFGLISPGNFLEHLDVAKNEAMGQKILLLSKDFLKEK